MFARVVKFEGVDFSSADEGQLEAVRDRAMQYLEGIDGWQGGMQLVDRSSGTIMNIHLFDTEENMRAAEPKFEEMPQHLGDDVVRQIAGRRSSVERYSVEAERRKGG